MRLFHSTTQEAAEEIDRSGFRDNPTASYNGEGELSHGVWLADRDMTDAFQLGGAVFVLDIPDHIVEPFEWLGEPGESSTWRAFLVPAAIVNAYRACSHGAVPGAVLAAKTGRLAGLFESRMGLSTESPAQRGVFSSWGRSCRRRTLI